MESDRRRSKRESLVVEVEYEGAGGRAETRIFDIGLYGVFIDTISPLQIGATLKLAFPLPGGHKVVTDGVVVHRQEGVGMGVEFTSLSDEDRDRIRDLVEGNRDVFHS